MEWREQGKIRIINLDYSRGDFGLFQRSAWKNAMHYVPGEKRGQGELVHYQGPLSPFSRVVHTNELEIKLKQ